MAAIDRHSKGESPAWGVRGFLLGKRGIGDHALLKWVCGSRKRFKRNASGFGSVALARAVRIKRMSQKDADAEEGKQ
jgi:hypothetical protein